MGQKVFICFIGMDGSGKTTLARIFYEKLQRRGVTCRYVHGLIEPMLIKPFLKFGRNILSHKKAEFSKYMKFSEQKRRFFSKYPSLIPLYKSILFADYAPQMLWKIYIPLYKGESIVTDRYIYDTVINMGLNLRYDVNKLSQEICHWFRMFPEPNITFLLDVDEDIALSRKDDVPSIEYLKERRGLYLGIASKLGISILDGSHSIDELCDKVDNTVKNYI